MSILSTLLSETAVKYPNKVALIIDQRSYTYRELYVLTRQLATSLLEQGVSPNEGVAFLLPNSLEIILCYYACFMIGAVAIPINIHFNNEMVEYALKHSKARIFITTPQCYEQLFNDEKIVAVMKPCYLTSHADNYVGVHDFQKLLSHSDLSAMLCSEIGLEKTALIFFTSGTTGLPKAVVHSHHSLIQGMKNQISQIQIKEDDATLVMFPVCYLIGLGSQILPFHAVGATVVLLPRFYPVKALAKLQLHQITKIYGFPKLYLELINSAQTGGYKINTLNFCFSGGDATPISLQKRFKQLFNIEITEGCGMSELQIYSMNPPYGEKKIGSIGFPIEGVEMRLIDEKNRVISKPHLTGEIIVRGGSMSPGYWQNLVLTEKTIKNGWFHTGDLAYRDKEGCYWFVSRKVDIIKCGEELISPLDIENVIYQHKAVKEAAAIALPTPDKEADDRIILYVVLKMIDATITPQTLMNFVCTLLPVNKRPKQIIIRNQLPYGFTGKIDRRELRNLAKKQLSW